jgi:isoprenylcysteine carboxyl methyltransferase (ICMT) family protein YpbQ
MKAVGGKSEIFFILLIIVERAWSQSINIKQDKCITKEGKIQVCQHRSTLLPCHPKQRKHP